MGKETGISWTHHTFNPWTGCEKVSPGCANCYAERDSIRYGLQVFGRTAARQQRAPGYWNQLAAWNRAAIDAGERRRVFLMSFGDFWEDREDLAAPRKRTLGLIEECRALDFLIVTKRIENAGRLLEAAGFGHWLDAWPRNTWAIVTAENDAMLQKRAEVLATIPAIVRGFSFEPLVGPLPSLNRLLATGVFHWGIVGGESGPRARPMHPAWAGDAIEACRAHGVAVWWKQWGAYTPCPDLAGQPGPGRILAVDAQAHPFLMQRNPKAVHGAYFGDCPQELPAAALQAVQW